MKPAWCMLAGVVLVLRTAPSAAEEPMTFLKYVEELKAAESSEARREAFISRYDGQPVRWDSYVVSVQEAGVRDAVVMVAAAQPQEDAPQLFAVNAVTAMFTPEARPALQALRPNQRVTVSGTLMLGSAPGAPHLGSPRLEEVFPLEEPPDDMAEAEQPLGNPGFHLEPRRRLPPAQ